MSELGACERANGYSRVQYLILLFLDEHLQKESESDEVLAARKEIIRMMDENDKATKSFTDAINTLLENVCRRSSTYATSFEVANRLRGHVKSYCKGSVALSLWTYEHSDLLIGVNRSF